MKTTNKSEFIVKQAMIAAIYTVLSVCLSAISYGTVQVRVSEALTLLPVFALGNVWGVTIGCFLTNVIGFFTGANILGALDAVFGTAATLVAALLTYAFRNVRFKGLPIAAAIPPVIVNAVVIGMELCVLINGGFNPVVFWAQAVSVGVGQLLSCGVIGLIMVRVIERNGALKRMAS